MTAATTCSAVGGAMLRSSRTSPELPESSIVVRKDLDPAVKEKIRAFFLTYGQAPGPQGKRRPDRSA